MKEPSRKEYWRQWLFLIKYTTPIIFLLVLLNIALYVSSALAVSLVVELMGVIYNAFQPKHMVWIPLLIQIPFSYYAIKSLVGSAGEIGTAYRTKKKAEEKETN